jgi:Domain of unknown function DUF29
MVGRGCRGVRRVRRARTASLARWRVGLTACGYLLLPLYVKMFTMIERTPTSLSALYEQDETAWLEAMAQLVAEGRVADLDLEHLREYLTDMAKRDRREVKSRLVCLLTHLLKWEYQPEMRGRSWQATIRAQRRELEWLLESGTLRNHAEEVLAEMYEDARELAATETGLSATTFPNRCPWTVDELLAEMPEA